MQRSQFRCFTRHQVRWDEVDAQKIVFNAHYLSYVDHAFSDFWAALALPYAASLQKLGGDWYVRKATLQYDASAVLDDRLDIALRPSRLGRSSLHCEVGIFREQRLLVSAEMVYVFAAPYSQTPQPFPTVLREILQAFEAGDTMVRAYTGDWSALQADAAPLRHQVFVREQGFAEEDEWDACDAVALHAVLKNRLGQAVATGRLLQLQPEVGKIGRVCVDRALRGTGLGVQLLAALEAAALRRGDTLLVLHAQTHAQPFYQRCGYQAVGQEFDEDGMPHIAMHKALPPG